MVIARLASGWAVLGDVQLGAYPSLHVDVDVIVDVNDSATHRRQHAHDAEEKRTAPSEGVVARSVKDSIADPRAIL